MAHVAPPSCSQLALFFCSVPLPRVIEQLRLQYRADSVIRGGTLDGQRVEGKPAWAN